MEMKYFGSLRQTTYNVTIPWKELLDFGQFDITSIA